MKSITVRVSSEDEITIEGNLLLLSKTLGANINLSELLRFVLLNLTSKNKLFEMGFINYREYMIPANFIKGSKKIKLKTRI